jgi:hypothetical protein
VSAKKSSKRPTKAAAKKPAAKRARKPAAKTAARSPGVAVSPLNGATIPLGAHPGNTGGKPGRSGRIKEKVKRQLLRAAARQGPRVLEQIARGDPVQRAELPLLSVLRHAVCPNCGETGLSPKDPDAALLMTIEATVSASPGDRRGAIDSLLKYSVGLKDELTVVHPDVQRRLEQTIAIIGSRESWKAAELLGALSPVWRQ